MASLGVLKKRVDLFYHMYSQEAREQTFVDWPFREDCMCTPGKMASAGFVHCPSQNEPDVACCFYCLLELEEWEPHDNPRVEHIKRSPNCRFLIMGKDFLKLTLGEFLHMEEDRLKIYLKKACHIKMADFQEEIERTLGILKSMFDSKP
ncbi:Baculoviral IAP repeat-containing protein 5.1 [Merluccius polli]|uniref:Baculoviral IAP repeat-containing protein 5.1 n=1 Tax=Merluccius polli TaxID=89951 RepID=A0AA47N6L3_MERPO|nr:Baculoviral IAP repeat-containing protein 5.1 [Merluccius polli]